MDNIELKSIRELLNMSFLVPSYQRGFRWTPQQVKDLLDDIEEFMDPVSNGDNFYCIQPLVVQETIKKPEEYIEELNSVVGRADIYEQSRNIFDKYIQWVVIDGQQRLTTIFLILKYLQEKPYTIEYETREGKEEETRAFMQNIGTQENEDKIYDTVDFYHFHEAYATISTWFDEHEGIDENGRFTNTLLDHVRFIWYRAVEENPIKVFTRLNIGKISLTNAELIKALFLNRSNFQKLNFEQVKAKQSEIAAQWDRIEYTLQDEEFWLFLHEIGYERPTRIDFIFDILCKDDKLKIGNNDCGNDDYRTFRYFAKYFKNNMGKGLKTNEKRDPLEVIKSCWEHVTRIFNTLNEWYNDTILYHYIGFLIACGKDLHDLINLWDKSVDKKDFINGDRHDFRGLKPQIKSVITNAYNKKGQVDFNLKDAIYEKKDGAGVKQTCRPILLLHNIQTIIAQNRELTRHEDYKQGIFYKFPFHLYKKENWDIEHIDSNNENPLENIKDQIEWLNYALVSNISLTDEIKKEVENYITNKKCEQDQFNNLHKKIIDVLVKPEDNWDDPENDKNRIWNYVLLDMHTNRGYGNSIYPAKRRTIMGKDRGIKYALDGEFKIHPTDEEEKELFDLLGKDELSTDEKNRLKELSKYSTVAFIPPCTRNVFMKYYTASPNNLLAWGKRDAPAYLENIKILLSEFLVK